MPQPRNTPDVEPGDRGRRPSWWRRAVAAVLRSIARPLGGRGNERGTYRALGREARDAIRGRRR